MKTRQFRLAGVAFGLACALFAIVFVGSGSANPPASGVNCQTDGQISGRGATFAARAQTSWIVGFHDDVCGSVSGRIGDNNMVIDNNPAKNGGPSDNGPTV